MISRVKQLIRSLVSQAGYVLTPKGLGYFDSVAICRAARSAGLPVPEYLERSNVGGVGRRREEIISKLSEIDVLKPCERIVEIGAGTGMYLEKFMERCKPARYEVYETNAGWKRYLHETYGSRVPLVLHDADGRTLEQSATNSSDLVTAHGVFVYLPLVVFFEYLVEAVRVAKVGGLLVFDCFLSRVFGVDEILSFRERSGGFDFPVVVDLAVLEEFCSRYDLKVIASFEVPYHGIRSTYFVIQKRGPL